MDSLLPLNDQQWAEIEPLFPQILKRGRGKLHSPWRAVINSILIVLLKRAKWGAIPQEPGFATKSAAHRWFVLWEKNGFLQHLLEKLNLRSELTSDLSLPPRRNRKQVAMKEVISEEPLALSLVE